MAITNAQQARQLYKNGSKKPVKQAGATNFLGKQEMVKAPKFWLSEPGHVKAKLAYITDEEEKILIDKNLYGSLKGKPNIGPAGLPSLQGGDYGSENAGTGGSSGNDGREKGAIANQTQSTPTKTTAPDNTPTGPNQPDDPDAKPDDRGSPYQDYITDVATGNLDDDDYEEIEDAKHLLNQRDLDFIENEKKRKQEEQRRRLALINSGGGGGGNNYIPPIIPEEDDEEEEVVPTRNLGGLAPRFAGSIFDFTGLADGGIARAGAMDGGRMMRMMANEEDDPTGGIMDLESGRQMYFLGKLVKKATRAIKKVVKSPIGKAALLGGAMYFGGGFGGGKGLSSFFGKGSFNPLKALITKGPQTGMLGSSGLGKIFGKFGLAKEGALTLGGKLGLGFGIPMALDALGIGKEEEDNSAYEKYMKDMRLDIPGLRGRRNLAAAFDGSTYNYEAYADGGRTGYQEGSEEPVAKKTMPLLDMDGQEMDLREDGGFVPLGRMERADDVPARLSKNEFVFTADAVRNAGEGDIDKGAEVMYNMMKNLESGGEVSEESQGLDGAREMFKTSQRLEEVL